jgi:ABC-type sugar transport system permease subunit
MSDTELKIIDGADPAALTLTPEQYLGEQRRYRRRKLVPVACFLGPFLSLWVIFLAVPMVWGIWLSFNTGGIIGSAEYVGLENWSRMWSDSELRKSLQNTGVYLIIAIAIAFTLAFILAMLLEFIGWGKNFYKVALYFPLLVPPIMAGMIFLFLTHYDLGAVNLFLRSVGLERINFLGENPNALLTIVALEVWRGLGFWVLFFLAALQSVPSDLMDAAKVDGAGAARRFFRVALPSIRPLLLFAVVIAIIFNAQLFDSVQVLTKGGPVLGTSSVVWFIYKRLFAFQDVGLAYATSVGLLAVVVLLTVLAYGVLGPKAEKNT